MHLWKVRLSSVLPKVTKQNGNELLQKLYKRWRRSAESIVIYVRSSRRGAGSRGAEVILAPPLLCASAHVRCSLWAKRATAVAFFSSDRAAVASNRHCYLEPKVADSVPYSSERRWLVVPSVLLHSPGSSGLVRHRAKHGGEEGGLLRCAT